jgi:hypothetical protein
LNIRIANIVIEIVTCHPSRKQSTDLTGRGGGLCVGGGRGQSQSQSDGLGRTERAAAAASVVARMGPERRPRVDGEGGRSGREAGEQARQGADGEVGLAAA